jgi:hypothetical protein
VQVAQPGGGRPGFATRFASSLGESHPSDGPQPQDHPGSCWIESLGKQRSPSIIASRWSRPTSTKQTPEGRFLQLADRFQAVKHPRKGCASCTPLRAICWTRSSLWPACFLRASEGLTVGRKLTAYWNGYASCPSCADFTTTCRKIQRLGLPSFRVRSAGFTTKCRKTGRRDAKLIKRKMKTSMERVCNLHTLGSKLRVMGPAAQNPISPA